MAAENTEGRQNFQLPKKVAVFLSDFHMGQGDGMEEFFADKEFAELMARLSDEYGPDPNPDPNPSEGSESVKGKSRSQPPRLSKPVGDEVDLVLLGDIMDLWTTITDSDEVKAQDDVRKVDLYFPASGEESLRAALDKEREKVKAVFKAHPEVFQALARFLIDDPWRRRIIYVPGNHDHSVVSDEIKNDIKYEIVKWCTRVMEQQWAHFIGSDEEMQMRQPEMDKIEKMSERKMKRRLGTKAWSALPDETKRGYIDGATAEVRRAMESLAPFFEATPYELGQRIEFMNCYLDPDLQVYAEHGNQLTYGGVFKYEQFSKFGKECPGYYELKLVWNRVERSAPDMDNVLLGAFSPALWPGLFWWLLRPGTIGLWYRLQKYRAQYEHYEHIVDNRRPDTVKQAVQAARGRTSTWQTVKHHYQGKGKATGDEFWDQVPQMFVGQGDSGECPLLGRRLDPQLVKTVILGHSHHPKDKTLTLKDGQTVKYYNTGSWIQRYEKPSWFGKGRQVTRQTWVTVSREMPVEGQDPPRDVTDRKLVQRDVEPVRAADARPQMFSRDIVTPETVSSPVTSKGAQLNPISRELTDIQVGDILLIRGNYGATIRRMLSSPSHWLALLRAVPDMIGGWFNRYGTFSSWNHVAVVYASPSERDGNQYNDLLIIEAVPGAGVAIHGPQHYMEYHKEHDLAVLRANQPWLNDNPTWANDRRNEAWDWRCLLRRFALANLEAEYDMKAVMRQTLLHTVWSMDRPGRSPVAGLVKGGFFGGLAGLGITIGLLIYEAPWRWLWTQLIGQLQPLLQPFHHDPYQPIVLRDTLLMLIAAIVLAILAGIALYTAFRILVAVSAAIIYGAAAIGAAMGTVLVPIMAELSGNWGQRSSAWRWVNTVLWMLIAVVGVGGLYILRIYLERTPVADVSILEKTGTLLATAAFFLAVFITWFSGLLTCLVTLVLGGGVAIVERLRACVFKERNGLPVDAPVTLTLRSVSKDFLCSGLAQEVLERTAEAAGKSPEAVRPIESITWRDILPKHFANAERGKFKWVYLFKNGQLTHNPDEGLIAEASPEPLDITERKRESPGALLRSKNRVRKWWDKLLQFCGARTSDPLKSGRELCLSAAWSLRLALLALLLVSAFHYSTVLHDPKAFWLLLAVLSSLLTLWLARRAWLQLALYPTALRGTALQYWGQRLGYAALVAAVYETGAITSSLAWDPQLIGAGLALAIGTWMTFF